MGGDISSEMLKVITYSGCQLLPRYLGSMLFKDTCINRNNLKCIRILMAAEKEMTMIGLRNSTHHYSVCPQSYRRLETETADTLLNLSRRVKAG